MANHRYHLTRLSANRKLGGIPASTQSVSTCPDNCSYKGNGCYASAGGPLALHWRAVNDGTRGVGFDEFCSQIQALPKGQVWRYGQAGDLPGSNGRIHRPSLNKLVKANKGRPVIAFTHYDPLVPHNAAAIKHANENGFTVNLSAETLQQVDEYVELGIAPVVVALPHDHEGPFKTEGGAHVSVCPSYTAESTCALCQICSKSERKAVIGFPSHGSQKAVVDRIFWGD